MIYGIRTQDAGVRRAEFSVAAPTGARRVVRPWSCHPSVVAVMYGRRYVSSARRRHHVPSVLRRCHVSSICRDPALCPPLLGIY